MTNPDSLHSFLLRDAFCGSDGSCLTDETAEVAANAFGTHHAGLAGGSIEDNSLMAAVHAGHIAASAAHALVGVYLRINDGLTVQVGGPHEIRQFLTHDISATIS
jgi:hypothetical protein